MSCLTFNVLLCVDNDDDDDGNDDDGYILLGACDVVDDNGENGGHDVDDH